MPIGFLEPLGSVIGPHIVWLTVAVYVATVAVKLAGYDQKVFFGLSYMELFAIAVSAGFTYEVIAPTTGLENLLAKLSWAVLAYAVVRPAVTFSID